MEDAIGGETDEDGGLRQGDADDAFEGDEFGAGLSTPEAGAYASGEFDDAGDADCCG